MLLGSNSCFASHSMNFPVPRLVLRYNSGFLAT